jgi:DNA-binding LacI/PurR family transcriptional regulator
MDGSGIVLVVCSDPLGSPWSAYRLALYSGVIQGAGNIGAPILLAHGVSLRTALPVGFFDFPLCGVVLIGHFKAQHLREYERLPIPVVSADTPVAGYKIHSVSVDNEGAMKLAVQHLVARGHRKIGLVRFVSYSLNDVAPDSKERHAGFLQAARDAGLQVRKDWIFNVLPDSPSSRIRVLQRLVDPRSAFTAAVAVDDICAAAVHEAATKRRRAVPRDFGIVMVNSLNVPSPYSGPLVDFQALGREAAPLLRMPKSPAIRIRVPVDWSEAGSIPELNPAK